MFISSISNFNFQLFTCVLSSFKERIYDMMKFINVTESEAMSSSLGSVEGRLEEVSAEMTSKRICFGLNK